MDLRARLVIAAMLAGGLLFGAGFLAGQWLAREPGPAESALGPAATDARADGAELARLERKLDLLREALREGSSTAAPEPEATRALVHAPPTSDGELARTLEELRAAIVRLSAAPPGTSTTSSMRLRTRCEWKSAAEILRGYKTAVEHDQQAEGSDEVPQSEAFYRKLAQAHWLWTLEDVLAQYGPPSRVENSKAGLRVVYAQERPDPDGGTDEELVTFVLSAGYVADVEAEL